MNIYALLFQRIVLPDIALLGAVIGANSVVTNSIPDYCVAAGAPARVVKSVESPGPVKQGVV